MRKYLSIIFLSLLTGQQFIFAVKSELVSDTLKSHALKEIVISSSFKETNDLKSLPSSVSILTPSLIDGLKVNTIKDLSMTAPNFFIPDYGSKLSTPVYIRGIGERATGQTIGLYVDNMPYMDKSAFDFDLTDIQRIEILRGPQGTLYGRNAMGGIVNIYTHSPLDYPLRAKGMVSGGNFGLRQAKATVSHRLDEKTGLSASGYYDSNDGYFTNQHTGKKADGLNAAGGRFRFDRQLSKQLKIQLVANYDYSDQGAFPYGVYDKDGNIAEPNYNNEGSYRRDLAGTGLNISYENKHFLLTSSTGYQHFNDNMKMDTDYSPQSIFSINQKQRQHAFSEEINIKSNNRKNYRWSFGTMGFYNKLHTNTPTTFGEDGVRNILQKQFDKLKAQYPNMPAFTIKDKEIVVPGDFSTPSYGGAVFHQSTYYNLFVEGLSVTAGVRLDYEKVELNYHSSLVENTEMLLITPRFTIQKDTVLFSKLQGKEFIDFMQVLPKFAIKYELSGDRYIYASAAKGYKSGGYNVNMFADLSQSAFREKYDPTFDKTKALSVKEAASYKPEYSWNYELGFKGEIIKDFLYAEFAGFYIDVKDVQLTQMVEMGRIINNAAGAESFGGEISLTASLLNNFSLTANYGYTHATFKNDTLGYSGKYVPFAPQNTLSLSAIYNKKLNKKWIDNLNVQTWYNAAGRIYWTEANNVYQDFYGVLNAKASFSKSYFSLAFWMKNILNEEYAAFYFESMGKSLAQRGKPMQLGVDLNFRF